MADIHKRILEARRRIMRSAFGRWLENAPERERRLDRIRDHGIGAGDTEKRRTEYAVRESNRAHIAPSVLRALALGQERMIGTWDATFVAPSEQARAVARSVARIVNWPDKHHSPVGEATGLLVTPNLLLTNHHVIPVAEGAEDLAAHFLYERTGNGAAIAKGVLFNLDATKFFYSHEELDFAVVGVEPVGDGGESIRNFGAIPLIEATGKTLIGKPINIVQHPNGGPRQYAVTNNRLTDILEKEGFLHYETDTERGSSGSPLFNENWEIVGLHHCGIPAMQGKDVMTRYNRAWDPVNDDDDDIHWIANEGTRTSFIVAALRNAKLKTDREREYLAEFLAHTADPLATAAVSVPSVIHVDERIHEGSSEMAASVFNISGNVTIHVSGDGAAGLGRQPAIEVPAVITRSTEIVQAFEKSQNFDPNYSERRGYDADFLGVEVPVPSVIESRRQELYTVTHYREHAEANRNVPEVDLRGLADNQALVIPYHRYSLAMNKDYRMAMWAASNADYREEMRGDTRPRKEFGAETWHLDRRVPTEYQLTNSEIYGPATNFDRGHLVRREDNAWGAPGLDTEYANSDTYHWTNCTPQHELFNQESPQGDEYRGQKGVWGFFESSLQKQLQKGGGQAVIFAGPVLKGKLGKRDYGYGEITYPLKFWKVAVVPESNSRKPKLLVYGFVFDQEPPLKKYGDGFKEKIELPQFDRQAKSLAYITDLCDVSFDRMLHAVDEHKNMN